MILAIIQARTNSTRLPRKVFLPLQGKSVIEHIIERTKHSKFIDKIVVATTTNETDDELVNFLQEKCLVFRGSEDDVLQRFKHCAIEHQADIIVRLTADDPLKDPEIIDLAIEKFLQNSETDYCSNTLKPSYPEGLDVEVFSLGALLKADQEAKLPSEREHVTPYIWKNPGSFKVINFSHTEDLSAWRWTLDKAEDQQFFEKIYALFYKPSELISYRDLIPFLKRNPDIIAINSHILRNEGYFKTLEKDSHK